MFFVCLFVCLFFCLFVRFCYVVCFCFCRLVLLSFCFCFITLVFEGMVEWEGKRRLERILGFQGGAAHYNICWPE